MAQALGEAYTLNRRHAAEIGIKFFRGAIVKEIAGPASVTQVLQHLAPSGGVIIRIDEAQKLRKVHEQNTERVTNTLDAIHNEEIGHPVMPVAAELSVQRTSSSPCMHHASSGVACRT